MTLRTTYDESYVKYLNIFEKLKKLYPYIIKLKFKKIQKLKLVINNLKPPNYFKNCTIFKKC